MKVVLLRYKTSAAHAEQNEALVREVFAELRAKSPDQIHYMGYRGAADASGVIFVHLARVEDIATNALTSLPTFQAFQARLRERCVEQPVLAEMSVVGSHGFGD